MAFKHVAAGIKYFKNGNEIEAMQCLNQVSILVSRTFNASAGFII